MRTSLGTPFARLWAAYAVSTFGSWLLLDAFAVVAFQALHASAAQVALLSAVGLAAGAALSVPIGPWLDVRRKRPVMIAMDLLRCLALLTVPVAWACGLLSLVQLIVVSAVVAVADIVFAAASGAFLKSAVPPEGRLSAATRFEATTWTATALGPPLGGWAAGTISPVVTVIADAVSFLLSALGILAVRGVDDHPRSAADRPPILAGWRRILGDPVLRPLFWNTLAVNALIMVSAPLIFVLMVGDLGFTFWQYGLAFSLPCLGGLVGSRLSGPLVRRWGTGRVLWGSGALRACWPLGLAFVVPGLPGLLLVMGVQFGLICCISVYSPVLVTERLRLIPDDRLAGTLAAWQLSSRVFTAGLIAAWGGLAALIGTREAIAAAGVALLFTPLLLPRRSAINSGISSAESGSPTAAAR
ncbi:MFS transporter [Pseudonocardiaceae bacterium YIM PH 21723]|nr:MFS transporter [Pseudonocardiaceae bacterium YIM PH 21723]